MGFTKVLTKFRSRRESLADVPAETIVLESHARYGSVDASNSNNNSSSTSMMSRSHSRTYSLDTRYQPGGSAQAPARTYSVARTLQSFKSLVRKPSARSSTAAARFEEEGLGSSHIVSQAKKQFLANNQKDNGRQVKPGNSPPAGTTIISSLHHHRTLTSTSIESASKKPGLKFSRTLLKSFSKRFHGRPLEVFDGLEIAVQYAPRYAGGSDNGQTDLALEGPQLDLMNRILTQLKDDDVGARIDALFEMKALVQHRWFQKLFWEEAIPTDTVCLVECLDTSNLSAATSTAHILRGLTSSSNANLEVLGEAGVIERLIVLLLRAVQKDDELLASAVTDTLAQLVERSANNQRLLAEAPQMKQLITSMEQGRGPCKISVGAIVHLLAYLMAVNPAAMHKRMDRQLLRSMMAVVDLNKSNKAVYDALSVIGLLVSDNPEGQNLLRETKGLESLMKLTQDKRLVDTSASDRAAWVLMHAVRESQQNLATVRELTMTYGWASLIIPAIVQRLDVNKSGSVINTALGLLTALSQNEDLLKSTVKFGVIQKLQLLVGDAVSQKDSGVLESCVLMLQELTTRSSVARNKLIQVGGMEQLMKALDSKNSGTAVERVAWIICTLAQEPLGQECILNSGCLPVLVSLIQHYGGQAEAPVPPIIMTLLQISEGDTSRRDALRTAGAVPALLSLTRSFPSSEDEIMVAEAAVGVLVNIAQNNPATQTAMFIHGAIPAMLDLAAGDGASCVIPVLAVAVLKAMAESNEQYKIAIREGGGLDLLLGLLEAGGEIERLEVASDTLLAMVTDCSSNLSYLCQIGGIGRIVLLLNQGAWSDVTARVLQLMPHLTKGNTEVQGLVRDSGGVELLLNLLKCGASHPITPHTAKALEELVKDNQGLQEFVAARSGIQALVHLLETGPATAAASHAASAIAALVDNNTRNQDRCRDAGAIPALLSLLAAGPTPSVATSVLTAIRALATNNPRNATVMRQEGVVSRLLHHLDPAASTDLTVLSLQSLSLLCSLLPEVREGVATEGGLQKLLSCMSTATDDKSLARTTAACNALCCACVDSPSNKHDARRAGAIPLLCQLLNVGRNEASALEAAFALSALVADNEANQDAVREAGGISKLVHLAAAGSRSSIAWVSAMCLLDCCRGNSDNQDAVRAANGIPVIIDLLCASHNDDTSEMLLRMLANLAEGNGTNSQAIYESGVLGLVADRMQQASPAVARWSAHMFEKLARSYPPVQEMVRECGILDLTVSLLKYSRDDTMICALLDLCTALSHNNTHNAWVLCDRGALDVAVNCMKSGLDEVVCQSGVKLLSVLSSHTQLRSQEVSRVGWVTSTLNAALRDCEELPNQVVEDAVECVGNMAHGCASLFVGGGFVGDLVRLTRCCSSFCGQPMPSKLRLSAATIKTLYLLTHNSSRAGCQLAAEGGAVLYIRIQMLPFAVVCQQLSCRPNTSAALLSAMAMTLLLLLTAHHLQPLWSTSKPVSGPSGDTADASFIKGGIGHLPLPATKPMSSATHDVYVWS